jgi:hypothetical protein
MADDYGTAEGGEPFTGQVGAFSPDSSHLIITMTECLPSVFRWLPTLPGLAPCGCSLPLAPCRSSLRTSMGLWFHLSSLNFIAPALPSTVGRRYIISPLSYAIQELEPVSFRYGTEGLALLDGFRLVYITCARLLVVAWCKLFEHLFSFVVIEWFAGFCR